MKSSLAILLLFLPSCTSQVATTASSQSAMEELRIALMDVRRSYGAQQMEIELLQEKLAKYKGGGSSVTATKPLESRLKSLEAMQEKIRADLGELKSHANQTASLIQEYRGHIEALQKSLKQQNKKLGEVSQLKSTLHSINRAIRSDGDGGKTYTVRPGDSLGKIAYEHKVTVDALKKSNGLTSNTILIGQELNIPE